MNSLAGRQRLQLDLYSLQHGQDLSQAQQTITADVAPTYIPPEAGQGIAYWPLRVWNRYDAFGLAQEATSLFNAMAPKVTFLKWSASVKTQYRSNELQALPFMLLPPCFSDLE